MSEARDLVQYQKDQIGRYRSRLTKRSKKIIRDALKEVSEKLMQERFGSWGASSKSATSQLLAQAFYQITEGSTGSLRLGLSDVVRQSMKDMVSYLSSLDKAYLGSVRPLAFDTLQWWERTDRELIGQTRLRQFRKSFRRYGADAVRKIEEDLAQNIVLGQSWDKARDRIWSRIQDVVGDREWAVNRIIDTEVHAAYNGTQLRALIEEDEPGDPMLKKLVATFDSRTGKDSILLHGQTRRVNEKFFDPTRGIEYDAPPNRPHDREIVVGWRGSWGDGDDFNQQTKVWTGEAPPDEKLLGEKVPLASEVSVSKIDRMRRQVAVLDKEAGIAHSQIERARSFREKALEDASRDIAKDQEAAAIRRLRRISGQQKKLMASLRTAEQKKEIGRLHEGASREVGGENVVWKDGVGWSIGDDHGRIVWVDTSEAIGRWGIRLDNVAEGGLRKIKDGQPLDVPIVSIKNGNVSVDKNESSLIAAASSGASRVPVKATARQRRVLEKDLYSASDLPQLEWKATGNGFKKGGARLTSRKDGHRFAYRGFSLSFRHRISLEEADGLIGKIDRVHGSMMGPRVLGQGRVKKITNLGDNKNRNGNCVVLVSQGQEEKVWATQFVEGESRRLQRRASAEVAMAALDRLSKGKSIVPPTVMRTVRGRKVALQMRPISLGPMFGREAHDAIKTLDSASQVVGARKMFFLDVVAGNIGRDAQNVLPYFDQGTAYLFAVENGKSFASSRSLSDLLMSSSDRTWSIVKPGFSEMKKIIRRGIVLEKMAKGVDLYEATLAFRAAGLPKAAAEAALVRLRALQLGPFAIYRHSSAYKAGASLSKEERSLAYFQRLSYAEPHKLVSSGDLKKIRRDMSSIYDGTHLGGFNSQ